MQSPYDPLLRVQRRSLDAIRLSLIAELSREQAVEMRLAEIDTRIAAETRAAAGNWQLMSHPYSRRQKDDRVRLEGDRVAVGQALGRLRDATMEACGQMQAVTEASAAFVADRYRQIAQSEQAEADDFAGARLGGPRRAALGRA